MKFSNDITRQHRRKTNGYHRSRSVEISVYIEEMIRPLERLCYNRKYIVSSSPRDD